MCYTDYDGSDIMRASERFTQKTGLNGLYNIQAIENIPSIMRYGLLSNENASKIKHKSIAMNEVQERREAIRVPNGLRLHQYANVYFDPWNPMLSARRDQNEDICILKIDCCILDFEGAVVSDCNASSDYAGFYSPEDGMERINFHLVYAKSWRDENHYAYLRKKSIKCAEVLVPYEITYDYITCAAVVSESAKRKLENVGFDKRIYVMPEKFF